jgi:hypothetical protein
MLVSASDTWLLSEIRTKLSKTYTLTSKEDEYLGMNIIRNREEKSIILNQSAYIAQIIDRFELEDCETYPVTPMLESGAFFENTEPILGDKLKTLYQAKIGALLYAATHTRPDILFAVNMASRQAKSPTASDMIAVDRILLYLMGTSELGIKLCSKEGIILSATVDASYGNHKDRKSHTGVTLHIGSDSGSFLTRSKKQTITADSSTVAELIGAHVAAKEIAWARSLLEELGCKQESATVLYEDNMSTIAIINSDCNTKRTKHIDIRYNFIREKVQAKDIVMVHKPSPEMTSDILTKALGPKQYLHIRPSLLGMSALLTLYEFYRDYSSLECND